MLYKQLYMHYMYSQGKNWVNLFLSFDEWEGHQRRSITPYIHCLVYHIPEMIRRYGNLRKFSCQGAHTCRVQGHTHTNTRIALFIDGYIYQKNTAPNLCILFSCTGVEKNNDDAKRNYFSSNRWDAASDILETEYRLEKLSSYNRQKRKYEKQDENDWCGGGIEESRSKRKRQTPVL